ncbi:hypothetical protein ACLSTX_001427 [Campylobacter jejuni]
MKKGSGIILYNGTVEGKSANGSLTINGNFTADKTLFATYGNFVKVNELQILQIQILDL